MNRLSFLKEELSSVGAALNEALRHDYGPERSKAFFDECRTRLEAIGYSVDADPDMDATQVADHLRALASIGSRVALLERSHLGEFSWPFTDTIQDFAKRLFEEEEAEGPSPPIVHVIAEGIGYQIFDDDPDRMSRRRIMIVAFPRQLRHHVLLHSIFGHELGHPALKSDPTSAIIFGSVLPILKRGPLRDEIHLRNWLQQPNSPNHVKSQMAAEPDAKFSNETLRNWQFEIICDLFGLLMFGPAFAAAHRTILEPLCASPNEYDLKSTTHPPYPLRKRIISDSMRLLGWLQPVSTSKLSQDAEHAMLRYAGEDESSDWHVILNEDNLKELLSKLGEVFSPHPGIAFEQPTPGDLEELLKRLTYCRPPIVQSLDQEDKPRNAKTSIQHCLYAGWSFWFGMEALRKPLLKQRPDLPPLTFLDVNRLCEQAILQQRAIDAILDGAA